MKHGFTLYINELLIIITFITFAAMHLASEGIVTLGVTMLRCVCVRLAMHAAIVSVAKVMRCIQCSTH